MKAPSKVLINSASVATITVLFLICFSAFLLDSPTSSSASTTRTSPVVFSWQASMPYPVVDGHTYYPPIPPAVNSSNGPQVGTHWYAGTEYKGTSGNALLMGTEITTPSSLPNSKEFYYVLLSAFDNTGSYDQIGISDDWGVWGFTYSWTSGSLCNLTYYYNADALTLNASTDYIFGMGIFANTTANRYYVAFDISSKTELLYSVYLQTSDSSLTSLLATRTYSASSCEAPNYQNYEEVWNTTKAGGVPNFNFNFATNYWCSGTPLSNNCNSPTFTTWKAWKFAGPGFTVPKKVKVVLGSSGSVTIDN